MSTRLLATKLFLPPIRPQQVPRKQLIARLDAGLHHKLTLISAPAGSGKTTLASAWLHRSGRPAAWLSLDEGDNDPVRFFTYLIAALQQVEPEMGQSAAALLETPPWPAGTPAASRAQQADEGTQWAASLLTELINEVAAVGEPFSLALDDYHTITDLMIHQSLGFLLDRQPPSMHLLVITRHDPPLALSRLRARNQVTEIRQSDLRFGREEVALFLSQSMNLDLSAEEVAALEQHTEGWIAGLQLAALSVLDRDPAGRSQFIADFSGRHHFVLDYLTDEVLKQQPAAIRRFLLATSILQQLSGPLCDALLDEAPGENLGQQRLEQLEAANLFVVPLDDERQWYRYHHLFGELLQARLHETEPDLVSELHCRAAEWYEHNDLGASAVHHALATGDWELAAGMIERVVIKVDTWSRVSPAMLLHWFQALPPEVIINRPWLRLFTSRTAFATGQWKLTRRILNELEPWLDANPEAPDVVRIKELVVADRASYAAVRGEVSRAKTFARQLLDQVQPGDHIGRVRATAILGMAHFRAGEMEPAEHWFSEGVEAVIAADMPFGAPPFVCNLAEVYLAQGKLHLTLETCHRALELGTVDGQVIAPAGFAGLGMAKVYYEQNDLAAAEQALQEGLKRLGRGGIAENFGSMHAVLALIQQALGEADAAQVSMGQAMRLAQAGRIPRLLQLTSAFQARLHLFQGDLDAAAKWGREYAQTEPPEYLREFEDLTLARVLLAQDDPAAALTLLHSLLALAERDGRYGQVIEILALRALAQAALGELEGALDDLQGALELGEPEGYRRVFVDQGRPMAQLLKQAAVRGMEVEYVGQLLAALGEADSLPDQSALIEPLTERELEVLRLMAEGMSNPEIGQALFVSLPTVKTHARNIFGKLNVHGRQQAVERALALRILTSK